MALIGSKLRELREERDLTLKDVSEETGFAISFLSLLERDRVSISVDNLERLAQFYGVRLAHLFQGAEENPPVVSRGTELEQDLDWVASGRSASVHLVERPDTQMSPSLIKIGPGYIEPQFRIRDADSLVYVLDGRIKLTSEKGDVIELATGDSAYYFGFPGRRIENTSQDSPALILFVTSPPPSARDNFVESQQESDQ
jgi:transcriptional regulator with XRE-family HTH domain